jgi:ubiquitin carboxyl-terminal hydrolase 7
MMLRLSLFLVILVLCSVDVANGGFLARFFGFRGRRGAGIGTELPFTGLVNLGNTCYMNSLLQALFYVDSFRQSVMDAYYSEGSVGAELQNVFNDLAFEMDRRPVDTSSLARCLGLNVNVQEDTEEFFLKLLGRLQEGLGSKSSNPAGLFHGEFTQTLECSEMNFTSSKVQKFKDVSIQVLGHTSLISSLEDHFQVERLSRYNIPGKGEHEVDKKLAMRTLPQALCVHLKRFEFNPNHGRMMKVGQFFEYPITLDLSHFVDAAYSGGKYQLSAVVVHDGTSGSGHYTCTVRLPAKQDKWIILNDKIASESMLSQVREETFGGYEKRVGRDFTSKNAYLLLYARVE